MNRRATALVALVGLVVGCSPGSPAEVADSTPLPDPGTDGATSLTVAEVAHFPLGRGDTGPLATDGDTVVFPMGARRGSAWDTVVAVDIEGGDRHVLARSRWPEGLINWASVSGDWVFWVDQSHLQRDGAAEVDWAIYATNLRSLKSTRIARNTGAGGPYVPVITADAETVLWSEPTARFNHFALHSWSPVEGARVVSADARINPGNVTLEGDTAIALGAPASDGHHIQGAADCWSISLNTGAAEPLTDSGRVMSCAFADGRLAWSELREPAEAAASDMGLVANPYRVWSQLPGQDPVLLSENYLSGRYVSRTESFVFFDLLDTGPTAADDAGNLAALASDAGWSWTTGPGDLFVHIRGNSLVVERIVREN